MAEVKRGYNLTDSPFAKLRSLAILKRKLTSGLPNTVLAQEFGIAHDTVERALKRALKADLIQKFEDELFKDLVPQAIATAKAAMVDGNSTVALEILKGAGVLKKQSTTILDDPTDQDDLEIYIRAKRTRESNQADKAARLSGRSVGLITEGGAPEIKTELLPVDGVRRLPGLEDPAPGFRSHSIEGEVVE